MPRKKNSRYVCKNLLLLAGALLLSAILAEAGARIWLAGQSVAFAPEFRPAPELTPAPRWVRHPYFGYVSNTEAANNLGFQDPRDFPYRRTGDEIVVGIFGGSVAALLAKYLLSQPAFSPPAARGRRVVFLNFALGAYKQPQQFAIYSQFVDSLDISLNIDGLNEIYGNPYRLPVYLPVFAGPMFLTTTQAEWLQALLKPLRRIEDLALDLRRQCGSRTALECLLATALYRVANPAARALEKRVHSLPPEPFWDLPVPRDMIAEGAKNWQTYASLQALVAKAKKKEAIFILQPNQHVPGAKILTARESALIGPETPATIARQRCIARGYPLLRAGLAEVMREGGRTHDLSLLFAGNKEELFIDDCCHLTPLGNERLFARIAKLLDEAIRAQDRRESRVKN